MSAKLFKGDEAAAAAALSLFPLALPSFEATAGAGGGDLTPFVAAYRPEPFGRPTPTDHHSFEHVESPLDLPEAQGEAERLIAEAQETAAATIAEARHTAQQIEREARERGLREARACADAEVATVV
ncbi:MAG: hypothetical protein ACRD9R_23455, partial [Pyrinomonadaceae bacterium]